MESSTPEVLRRNARTAESRYSWCLDLSSGSSSRNAGSSTWMILMPAASRSLTSSLRASPICAATSLNGRSSRGKDHAIIVVGPVSMPFTGLSVRESA